MPSENKNPIHCLLASDLRFTPPSAVDDQVWTLNIEPGKTLSLFTTYGLRAKGITIFPEFRVKNESRIDPFQFHRYPQLEYQSTNFAEISFSPFSTLDARLKVWVPTSQIIVGQITCTNNSDHSRRLNLDWLVQLEPLAEGQPMFPARMGMNIILQGKTASLFPVFYLTGGPQESPSAYPGLSIDMLLVPRTSRQITWVLSSMNSAESSFQQARHYSSHQMDVEQLKVEMADKRNQCTFDESSDNLAPLLNRSQSQAYRLLMPAVGQFRYSTYVHERNSDLGFHLNEDLLEISPEWSGQTLPEMWMLAQNLLPGRPDVLKGLIQNVLDSQREDGSIEYRVSANRKQSGILAPPMLAVLVCELIEYNEDLTWLEQAYPKLIQFFKRWFSAGLDRCPELVHPIQTGLPDSSCFSRDDLTDLWLKLKSSRNPLVISLFYRETKSLIRIAGILKIGKDLSWLDQIRIMLENSAGQLWNDKLGIYEYRDSSTGLQPRGKQLCEFKQSGTHKPRYKITSPGRLSILLNLSVRLSPDFCCILRGKTGSDETELRLTPQAFQWIGSTGFCVTEEAFSSLESVEVQGWKKGDTGVIRQADLKQIDVFSLLPLWAGLPSLEQTEKMLASANIQGYMHADGIYLRNTVSSEPSAIRIPNFLAAMLIEGFVQIHRLDLADQFFCSHFNPVNNSNDYARNLVFNGSLEELIPVKLFMEISGLRKLTSNEAIVTHFNAHPIPVTVQYNQTKLILNSNKTEIITGSGESIILDKPGPHRIIFE